jgi:hypothetical protein
MSTYVKFPVGTAVVVECRHPRPSYKGVVLEYLQPGGDDMYYKVEPDTPDEGVLWIVGRRLKLAPILDDGMESWDLT